MALAPAMREACAILHSHGEHSQGWSLIRPMLQLLTINSQPVRLVKPDEPFTRLTLSLD